MAYKVGKSRFTVVQMENHTIIIKYNIRINSVFHMLTTVNLLLVTPVQQFTNTHSVTVFNRQYDPLNSMS